MTSHHLLERTVDGSEPTGMSISTTLGLMFMVGHAFLAKVLSYSLSLQDADAALYK